MDICQSILKFIDLNDPSYSSLLSVELKQSHQKIVGAIKSLESFGKVIEVRQIIQKSWECTDEGKNLSVKGSHEAQLFNFISDEGETIDKIKENFSASAVALGAALKNKWLKKEGNKVLKCVNSITDNVQINLKMIDDGKAESIDAKIKSDYKKRKLIKEIDTKIFEVKKGEEFSLSVSKQESELTKEMIESGQWKNVSFKSFNFNAKGKQEHRSGHLHPVLQLRTEFRHIFLEMGFTEMPTNNYIESAFWNFDALFQPQQHPARDQQDTFYVANPEKTLAVPMDYLERVKNVHSNGAYGSTGYRSPWSFEESQKNLLRTHTTAVSARLLYKLAQDGFKPSKYFSIDKVYRNETLDATHLAEFYQVEGVIADYNLSMKHLMGVFTQFFKKIGINTLRFKPTYNPYTEPSMEMFTYHEGLKKWVEVGNSGYFRPEMLLPMGLPPDVTVAGWGLSLERPAMIMFKSNNIRDLVGSKVKMDLIFDNPICTIDKFGRKQRKPKTSSLDSVLERQAKCLQKLSGVQSAAQTLAQQMGLNLENTGSSGFSEMPLDIVISADPSRPPFSLRPLVALLAEAVPLEIKVHTHSSIKNSDLNCLNSLHWSELSSNSTIGEKRRRITLIWKYDDLSSHPTMSINPLNSVKVSGEVNIARYFCRLLDSMGNKMSLYEGLSQETSNIDFFLDSCHQVLSSTASKKETMNFVKNVKKSEKESSYMFGCLPSLADLLWVSMLRQLDLLKMSSKVQDWNKDPLLSLVLKDSKTSP